MVNSFIEMPTDLYRDPRVILMADSLMADGGQFSKHAKWHTQCDLSVPRNTMRNAIVGALVLVLGIAISRGRPDGDVLRINKASPGTVDEIADFPGFGDAMVACGWLAVAGDGIVFTNMFARHQESYDNGG